MCFGFWCKNSMLAIIINKFQICKVIEPIASDKNLKLNPKYKNQLNMPYFMIIVAKKVL